MSKKIVFKIDNEGSVAITEVEGYGSSCLEATKQIEKGLGLVDETSRKFTSEYNDPVEQKQEKHIRH